MWLSQITLRWLHLTTPWHGVAVYNIVVTHVRILTFTPSVYRNSTIKLVVNNEDGSNWERLCDVLVCDKYDKYTISDKM